MSGLLLKVPFDKIVPCKDKDGNDVMLNSDHIVTQRAEEGLWIYTTKDGETYTQKVPELKWLNWVTGAIIIFVIIPSLYYLIFD